MIATETLTEQRKATLRLCGGFQFQGNDYATSSFRSGRVVALLAYLALQPSGRATREELADRLWPQLDGPTGRNNLRVTLQYLKQILAEHHLPSDAVTFERQWIAINPERIDSDVQAFRRLCCEATLTDDTNRKIELHTSAVTFIDEPLLPELYDEWIEPLRLKLSDEHSVALCDLAAALIPSNPSQALLIAKKASAKSPLDARGPELVATAYLSLRKRMAAADVLRRYEDLRLEELGEHLPAHLDVLLADAEKPDSPKNHLRLVVAPTTSFRGREAEMRKIERWLEDGSSRLLTIYGPGGIGKTRLATEASAQISTNLPSLWVDLAHVSSGEGLLESVIRSAGPAAPSALSPLNQLASWFAGDALLLVLDNVEQIHDKDLSVVADLLSALPKAKILITSRKTLGIAGERLLRLAPLALPDKIDPKKSASFLLFLDRAQASRPDLVLGDKENAMVAEITTRLEGIPLAIELAAARLTAMEFGDLVEGVGAPLDFLVSPRRTGQRHGALRTTLEWSFSHLDHDTAKAVRRFGCLRGTWDAAAARALCQGIEGFPPVDQVLQKACEHSLITLVPGSTTRYKMLECTRQFAWESSSTEEQHFAIHLLAEHYSLVAQNRIGDPTLLEELPNLEAALTFFTESEERVEQLLKIVQSLMWLLTETSAARSVHSLLESAVPRVPMGLLQAKLLLQIAFLQLTLSLYSKSAETAKSGIAIAKSHGDEELLSELQSLLAKAMFVIEPGPEALAVAQESVAYAGENPRLRARALQSLARLLNLDRDLHALELIGEAVDHARATGDRLLLVDVLDSAGAAESDHHRFEAAQAYWKEMESLQDVFLPNGRKQCLLVQRLGALAEMEGRLADAQRFFEESLEIARACNYDWGITQALTQLGDVVFLLGDYERSLECHLLALDRRREDVRGTATSHLGAGTSLLALGKVDEGYEMILQAVPTVDELGADSCLYRCIVPCAEAALRSGNLAASQRIAARGVTLLSELLERGINLSAFGMTPEDLARAHEIASLKNQ